jgi:hypothetical protein
MTWNIQPKPTTDDWTRTNKPSESSILILGGPAGQPIGLLLALTYAEEVTSILTGWTDVIKPSTDDWTSVPKPTT